MRSAFLDRDGGAYIGKAHTDDDEFSIADFVDLLMRAFGVPRTKIAAAVAADPQTWSRTALTGLERQRLARGRWTRPLVAKFFASPSRS